MEAKDGIYTLEEHQRVLLLNISELHQSTLWNNMEVSLSRHLSSIRC